MSEPTYTPAVRQEIKFYRILLLNAALTAISQEYRRKSKPLPPLRQLSDDVRAYWRDIAGDAVLSGSLQDMSDSDIKRLLNDLALDLPQYR